MKEKLNVLKYFGKSLSIVLGIILIWRGIWYLLDEVDQFLFGGSHVPVAIIGIIIGLLILYLPDKDLNEISKL